MRLRDNLPTTREKIQDVLDVLSSKEVFLDPNTRYTKAEMIRVVRELDCDLRQAAAEHFSLDFASWCSYQ